MAKAKAAKNPRIPSSTEEFVNLLQEFPQLGLNFRATASADGQSAVIFISEAAEDQLNSGLIVEINFDGTFLSSPEPYTQTWVVMELVGSKVFPLITVLMTGRKKTLYKAVLAEFKQLYPNFAPRKAMGDFELAARNALRETYAGLELSSCQFHHGQNCFPSHYPNRPQSKLRNRARNLALLARLHGTALFAT
jgi:hypothetical protein